MDNTNVQLEDVGHAYSPEAVSIKVTGGPLSATGKATTGRTNIFSGASSGNRISYDVSGGAQVLVRDLWYDKSPTGFANIHDRALFMIDGARVSTNGTLSAFNIVNLNGRVAILSTHIDDRIVVSGNGSRAKVLALGGMAEQKSPNYFLNNASPPAEAALLNYRHVSILPTLTRSTSTSNAGMVAAAFIREMLSHTRGEHAEPLTALPQGITDLRLFRV